MNYEVLNLESIHLNPFCKHGPTIIFKNEKKSFYSCSACRDHKMCNFYHEYDPNKNLSQAKLRQFYERYIEQLEPYRNYKKIREQVLNQNNDERTYCQSCNKFISKNSKKNIDHSNHLIINNITNEMLKKPIKNILKPLEINSVNAQFVFSDETNKFLIEKIVKLNFDSVLCIGTPSIFENLDSIKLNRFLLDIDDRFMYFYDEDQFQKFNMFNNHFFYDKQKYLNFLSTSNNLLILIDPPYGGLVKLISNTIESIKNDFIKKNISIFLFYPYFIENWIQKWIPEFNMLDYKVSYGNHKKFCKNEKIKKGSPARIFTNIALDKLELPLNQGYHYCDTCKKYTFNENTHCYECNKCPSKDGFYYKHCKLCNRCVKTSYLHCKKCKKCHLISEDKCENKLSKSVKRKLNQSSNNKNKNKKLKKLT